MMHLNFFEHGDIQRLSSGRDSISELLLDGEAPGPVDLLLLLQLDVVVLLHTGVGVDHAVPGIESWYESSFYNIKYSFL